MRAGLLRHRVTLRRMPEPTNNGGVPVPGEPEIVAARISAEVMPATAQNIEQVFAGQVQASTTHLVRMRHRTVRLTDEIVWHDTEDGAALNRVLRVTGRQADAKHIELVVAAQEVTS
jgi:hypothetical protein